MKNSRLLNLTTFFAATFLVFAAVETLALPKTAPVANAEESTSLEVPLTGRVETRRTSETYESLIEICFLALVLLGFYVVNSKRSA